jgi:hypothetical protein
VSTADHEPGMSGGSPPAGESEATGLWPIDDPERTTHILRPPGLPGPGAAHVAPPAPGYPPGFTGTADPVGTQWPPTQPTDPPPHRSEYGAVEHPQAGYPPHPGYPPPPAYPPAPGYTSPPASGYPPPAYPPAPGYTSPPGPALHDQITEPHPGFELTVPAVPTGSHRRTVLLIGAALAAVVIAAVGVTGFWKPGFFIARQLNISKVQDGVQHILTDQSAGYGITGVSALSCNNGHNPSANQGDTFTCEMTINGTKRHVEATVVDSHGTYQVGTVR